MSERRYPGSEYRRLHFFTMHPPLALGGHHFAHCKINGEVSMTMVFCLGCSYVLPMWAIAEGQWMPLAGRWCPGLLAALPPAGTTATPAQTGPDAADAGAGLGSAGR